MLPLAKLKLATTQNLKTHELAGALPMLGEEELQLLADSIKERGLNHPIVIKVIDGEDYLIDGRNRLAACRLADVEPTFIEWMGDVASFIYSVNVARRHMTLSQSAIAEALIFPKGKQGKGKKTDLTSPDNDGSRKIGADTMRFARHLVNDDGAKDLIEQIKKGSMTVSAAYKNLKSRQDELNIVKKQLKELKENASDLFESVRLGQPINEVYASYQERKAADRLSKLAILNDLRFAHAFLGKIKDAERARHILNAINSEYLTGSTPEEEKAKINSLLESITILKEEAKKQEVSTSLSAVK